MDTSNNSLQHCFTVVNSYDPNNKIVFPEGNIDTAQHWLTYTINFQNTGTAAAQHVYILDSLDADFDESTFTLLSYSHYPLVQVVGNIVRFNFPNINLPDSNTNEPKSHGYVQYRIRLMDGLPFGTTIENTAHIVFDFNQPFTTNTVVNELVNTTSIYDEDLNPAFRLYPNPTVDYLIIEGKFHISGFVAFFDIIGQQVLTADLTPHETVVDVRNLVPGIYIIKIITGGKQYTQKAVVQQD